MNYIFNMQKTRQDEIRLRFFKTDYIKFSLSYFLLEQYLIIGYTFF